MSPQLAREIMCWWSEHIWLVVEATTERSPLHNYLFPAEKTHRVQVCLRCGHRVRA